MSKQQLLMVLAIFLSSLIILVFYIQLFPQNPDPPNIILLGWDGVQQNHLYELLNQDQLPNINILKNQGALVNLTISDHATDTYGGWTQILTGYRWWNTGIYSNDYWFNSIPNNYTIIEQVENHFGKENIKTAFFTSFSFEYTINYSNQPLFSNLPSNVDLVDLAFRNASETTPIALQFIEEHKNMHFFTFILFGETDIAGHIPEGGENSELYDQAIKECDFWLGEIIKKLKELNIYHKTLIYLTSDHGFDENGRSHFYAPDTFLASNDNNLKRNGDQVDVAPTIYEALGILDTINPTLDGVPLQEDLMPQEKQYRQNILSDKIMPSIPVINSPKQGEKIKTDTIISYTVFDDYLSTILLIVDNKIKLANLTWNNNENEVYGSYEWDINEVEVGSHTIEVLVFDKHGALNRPASKSITVEITK